MIRTIALGFVVFAMAAFSGAVAPAGATRPVSTGPWADAAVLQTGYSLSAAPNSRHYELATADRQFSVEILGDEVLLSENEHIDRSGNVGETLWSQPAPTKDDSDDSTTLTMQRNGNLVLRMSTGRMLWSSRTAGTGHHNYLRLSRTGNLVVRTGAGKPVWQSHTTAVLLVSGQHLLAGDTMVNRVARGDQPTRLAMTRGGDLVLSQGTRQVWHAGTSIAGSYLTLRTTGRLAIVTPSHHVVWRSPSLHSHAVMRVVEGGRLVVQAAPGGRCWERPAGAGPGCA